jgi:hypothetical protein
MSNEASNTIYEMPESVTNAIKQLKECIYIAINKRECFYEIKNKIARHKYL